MTLQSGGWGGGADFAAPVADSSQSAAPRFALSVPHLHTNAPLDLEGLLTCGGPVKMTQSVLSADSADRFTSARVSPSRKDALPRRASGPIKTRHINLEGGRGCSAPPLVLQKLHI